MSEKTHYLETLTAELAQALGEAVWAFSMIEKLTYQYMKALSSEPMHILMAGQSFTARISLIKRLLERLTEQNEAKASAMKYLNRAVALAKTRNMLAHNPWSIWVDLDTAEFVTEIEKVTDETKTIDLTEVRKFRDDARELASSLEYALVQLRYPGP